MRANRPRRTKSPLASSEMLKGLPPPSGVLEADEVHRLRRVSKRIRAVLRLAEDAGRANVRQARHELADAVKPFGVLRDATVVARVAEKMALKLKGGAQAAARTMATLPPPRPNRDWWMRHQQRVRAARARIERLDHRRLFTRELTCGLKHSVRRVGKRANRAAKQPEDIKRAHAWRKAVVVLHDQLSATQPALSRKCAKLLECLQEMSHQLGRAVDCTLFIDAVTERSWPKSLRNGADVLLDVAREKRAAALKRAHKCWPKVKRKIEAGAWKPTRGGNH